ncbi:SH3 domain-containing protein, partial [Devosia sp. LC5]|uniref:SH3 domain-containing protein n=1 Tax=Devosia sp. LC5 TaxID=1502724 RepID=UPI00068A20AB
MALRNKLIAGGLAAFAVLATATAAMAAPAYATSNVNVRSGPGTGYGVVDTLRRGEQVDVQQCRGSWCYVEKRGPDGWVSANYLSAGGWDNGWNRPPPPPPTWNPRPPRPPHWGGGWGRPRPPPWGGGGPPPR